MVKIDFKTCDLDFLKGTVYKDVRGVGETAYRDIKRSLKLGTISDLVYYLKKYSTLLKDFDGDETAEIIFQGMFSAVYLIKDKNGKRLVVKRSHDGLVPLTQITGNWYFFIPRFMVNLFFAEYDITPDSLKRDVYDYEKIVRPFYGPKRAKIESEKFIPYLNMALHMEDHFIPDFTIKDIYSKTFWQDYLHKKPHKKLKQLQKYLKSVETQDSLIPAEERFIVYDGYTKSLQSIFIQEAMIGEEEIVPKKRMAFPFQILAEGKVPTEMPKLMLELLLRAVESFVTQLDYDNELKKVPDLRPFENWKVFPPTPFEIYIAETNNVLAYRDKGGEFRMYFVDTHLLLEPEGNLMFRWVEARYWKSMFLNLRFWIRKALPK